MKFGFFMLLNSSIFLGAILRQSVKHLELWNIKLGNLETLYFADLITNVKIISFPSSITAIIIVV